jgi:hypothetical protein
MTRTERLKNLIEFYDHQAAVGDDFNRETTRRQRCEGCWEDTRLSPCPACLRLVSETLAAQAVEKVAGWQPIESAPKDGTEILVGWVGAKTIRPARWVSMNGWIIYMSTTKPLNPPTHWMPLPSPPVRASSQDGGDR